MCIDTDILISAGAASRVEAPSIETRHESLGGNKEECRRLGVWWKLPNGISRGALVANAFWKILSCTNVPIIYYFCGQS